jgi:hypothetical protein
MSIWSHIGLPSKVEFITSRFSCTSCIAQYIRRQLLVRSYELSSYKLASKKYKNTKRSQKAAKYFNPVLRPSLQVHPVF